MKKAIALLICAAILLTACHTSIGEDDSPPDDTMPKITVDVGDAIEYLHANFDMVNIDGSTSMIPLHQSLKDMFSKKVYENEWEREVRHSRTVDAFGNLIDGKTDILFSVDFSQELLDYGVSRGLLLQRKSITREAFVFLINQENSVKSLTTDQIKGIYSGQITNWNQVGGNNAAINAFQRNPDSGSQIRMEKFMGSTPLSTVDVKYINMMGTIIEEIANFDSGRNSIAYNMYTFAEKQFTNTQVTLLAVDGVTPSDDTIFDNSYPLVIYNYLYYDGNNEKAAEFAENLYAFLMSEQGQKLISDSGYVNLNMQFDRNKNVERPWGYDDWGRHMFYNPITGEFYDLDMENGNWEDGFALLTFTNYADYVLHRFPQHMNNTKAREFIMAVYNSNLNLREQTLVFSWGNWQEEKDPRIFMGHNFSPAGTSRYFCNYMFDGKYYAHFYYDLDKNKLFLETYDSDWWEEEVRPGGWIRQYFADMGYESQLDEILRDYIRGSVLEITFEDLERVYITLNDELPLVYTRIFK
jgi:ABC-type phosphate transport system substrate-binding protein